MSRARASCRFRPSVIGLCVLAVSWCAPSAAQSPVNPALMQYVRGLDLIRQGKYPEAIEALTQAMQASADPSFILARGAANCLNGRFREAIADFEQAKRSGLKGREADLWIYVAQMMSNAGRAAAGGEASGSGKSVRSTQQERSSLDHRGPRGQGWFGGAPGHIIQGRDDYPTDYASFVYYEMATPYAKGVTPAVREAMRQAGAWFANRASTRADLAPAHLARARELYAQRAYAAVLDSLAFVRPVYPGNADVHAYGGSAWLLLGRPATARRELTIGLTAATRMPGGYLNRAFAAARLGDAARAQSDFDLVAKYDAAMAARDKGALEQTIATNRTGGQPQELLAALEAAARTDAPADSLTGQAIALRRAMAPRRLRYDEWYQDRLRELEDAVRAAPRSAAPYIAMARFLIDEANLAYRGENVEPRHGPVAFRWQQSKNAELQRAVTVCDEALAAQPGDIAAQTVKAIALVRLGQEAAAEAIVNRVLQAAPSHPEALRLRAKFLVERAQAMYARAAALRAPRVESSSRMETRSDGVYRITETTTYPPTQQALAEAAQLERQAAELVRASNAALSAALAVLKGTFDGDMLSAEVNFASGRHDAAFADLQSALRRQPRSLEANQMLAELYRRLGRVDESERQMSVTTNLVHTNAGWMLRTAWRKVAEKDPAGARAALDAARRLDPEDARVHAYTGSLLAQQGNAAEARAAYRVALALEQARLVLDDGVEGQALPREAAELATLMKARNALAGSLLDRQPQGALEYYGPNTALARRISRAGRAAQMFGAMLPDPNAPAVPVPAPPNAAQLMAEAYNGAGRAYKALGRTQESMREFQAAIDLTGKPGVPGIGSGREGDTNFGGNAGGGVAAASFVEMAKTALARGDCQEASRVMQRATQARFPPEMREEANQLQFAIARCIRDRR